MIGLVAGVVCFFATQTLKRRLRIDDSLDVFPVHGVGGFSGLLLTAVFSAPALGGLGLPAGVTIAKQLGVQLLGATATAAWCGIATFVLLKVVNAVVPLRLSASRRTRGSISCCTRPRLQPLSGARRSKGARHRRAS